MNLNSKNKIKFERILLLRTFTKYTNKEFVVVLKYQNTPYIIQVLISVLISKCQTFQEKIFSTKLMLLIRWHLILIAILFSL